MTQSERLKRKAIATSLAKFIDQQEKAESQYFLVLFKLTNEYATVAEKDISIDENDESVGIVKYRNKLYDVQIIRKGTYERIKEKERLYAHCLSIETTDEEVSNKRLKLMVAEKEKLKKSAQKQCRTDLQCIYIMGNVDDLVSFQNDERQENILNRYTTSSVTHSKEEENSTDSEEDDERHINGSLARVTLNGTCQRESVPERDNEKENYSINLEKAIKLMDSKMKALEAKFEGNLVVRKTFIWDGVDIIEEIQGKNFLKWALNVSKHLFTDDEFISSVLTKSSKTERGVLDPIRVTLLKNALIHKYKLEGEKLDKAWSLIRTSINSRGRNLKWSRTLKTLITSTANFVNGGTQ